jgi:hypothetical protein
MAKSRGKGHPLAKEIKKGEEIQPADETRADDDDVDALTEPGDVRDILDDPEEDEGDAAARLPASVEAHHERVAEAYQQEGGGAPYADRGLDEFVERPISDTLAGEATPAAGRNFEQEPTRLVRHADAGDADTVHLDRRHDTDRDAPKGGEEGGAELGASDTRKKNPGAPWPGPGDSLADGPTPSPEPGPEPTVQFNPPQDVTFEHKPEAAVGLKGPSGADQELRRATSGDATITGRTASDKAPEQLMREQELAKREEGQAMLAASARERGGDLIGRNDGVERDEAGQVRISHLVDRILAALGETYSKVPDEPSPHRLSLALMNAAKQVMSQQWWDIKSRHFPAEDKNAS